MRIQVINPNTSLEMTQSIFDQYVDAFTSRGPENASHPASDHADFQTCQIPSYALHQEERPKKKMTLKKFLVSWRWIPRPPMICSCTLHLLTCAVPTEICHRLTMEGRHWIFLQDVGNPGVICDICRTSNKCI